jgi:hypothetical protein
VILGSVPRRWRLSICQHAASHRLHALFSAVMALSWSSCCLHATWGCRCVEDYVLDGRGPRAGGLKFALSRPP